MLTLTEANNFLEEFWTTPRKQMTRYRNHPFMAMVPKDEKATGELLIIPIDLDDGADGSPDFTEAQAAAVASSPQSKQFQISWAEDFQLARVRNNVLRQSASQKHSFAKVAMQTQKAQFVLSNRLARGLYRQGYGEKGVISASTTLTTKVINLATPADTRFFKIGDRIVFAQSLAGHVLRDSGDFLTVTKINEDTGDITTDAPTDLQTSITGIATGDFIFNKGARQDSATPSRLMVTGLSAFIPDSSPSDTFNNVARGDYPTRLGGHRYPASGSAAGPVEEIFLKALGVAGDRGLSFSHSFVAANVYNNLQLALQGKPGVEYISDKVGVVGFSGFKINAGWGEGVKCFPDPDCISNRAYNLLLETWKYYSVGEVIQNDLLANGKDGQAGRDIENASGLEWRYVVHGQLGVQDPGQNQVVKFA